MAQRYNPQTTEPELEQRWQDTGIYHFSAESDRPVYAIDTPPPTVSGYLHLGSVFSYSHTDFIARYRRMTGHNVYYPMGYDDNGLPTERFVERTRGVMVRDIGRKRFVEACLEVSVEVEARFTEVWRRLGLSVDWRHTYRTIDDRSRTTAQLAFLDLYRKGLVYRQEAPTIWCPTCHTAIAQAEVNDLDRESEFVTVPFELEEGSTLPIATTRPELLPACVAVFVHPGDRRYAGLTGGKARLPLFGQEVPVLEDPLADPDKGTGAVMCCTFGDVTDVEWWRLHHLPLREVIDREGRMTDRAGALAELSIADARQRVKNLLDEQGLILERRAVEQSVRVHERCDTPVEYIVTKQWFVRVLDHKEAFLEAGEKIAWHPAHMKTRYREWVQNLHWDWCISRQRYFGVQFPVWFCQGCGEIILAEDSQLPVDPLHTEPPRGCNCGGTLLPEEDVMDTWATSSLSPQIAGEMVTDPAIYDRVFPMDLRPQSHDIIRTWAFDTIVQSHYHWNAVPWKNVVISGFAVAPKGEKISKSRGGGPLAPMEVIERYSADAVRYWAASIGPGKDTVIGEEKMQAGAKLVTKLWNVAQFAARFLDQSAPSRQSIELVRTDSWLLSRMQRLIRQASHAFDGYDYATAKNDVEQFFWHDLADNYLEMAKKRLYDATGPRHESARFALYHVLLSTLELLAPVMPFITDAIYRDLFAGSEGYASIHAARWPEPDESLVDEDAEVVGAALIAIAAAVRGYKSSQGLSLGAELPLLHICASDSTLRFGLDAVRDDISSVTRARDVQVSEAEDPSLQPLTVQGPVSVAIERG